MSTIRIFLLGQNGVIIDNSHFNISTFFKMQKFSLDKQIICIFDLDLFLVTKIFNQTLKSFFECKLTVGICVILLFCTQKTFFNKDVWYTKIILYMYRNKKVNYMY